MVVGGNNEDLSTKRSKIGRKIPEIWPKRGEMAFYETNMIDTKNCEKYP